MPLSEGSKSKVGLASLSASTAAAAETLWTKSRKSSKRVSSAPAAPVGSSRTANSQGLENQCNNSHTHTASASTAKEAQVPYNPHPHQPLDRQEFRRKFLEGLQFYCENSSLILNSDLPADLIEFVTSHGFSVESLGIILELKKSSSAFSAYVSKKDAANTVLGVKAAGDKQAREQNFSEISRRLLQHWMSADSCAEAFVSLSLGEEIPGLIAECANFQRILFSIPDYFHLGSKDFLSFLLGQVLLAIHALTFGIRASSQPQAEGLEGGSPDLKVRTQGLACCLERIFLRYFSDAEYFYEPVSELQKNEQIIKNPFQSFITELSEFCKTDFIGRRLTSKIFLHLGSHAASKLAKVVFSCKHGDEDETSTAFLVMYPRLEFVENSSQWKYIIRSLPVKTVTTSKRFWSHWAAYVAGELGHCLDFWKDCVEHWIILNRSTSVDVHRLYSASLAVAALARKLKLKLNEEEDIGKTVQYVAKLEPGKVLQNIIHSLESVNEDKRACGMALGQVVADLQTFSSSSMTPSETEALEPLKFECKSTQFLEIVNFYENGLKEDSELIKSDPLQTNKTHLVEVLDSDDDLEEGEENENDGFPIMQDDNVTEDARSVIDPRILTLRARKRKIPMYFSEIVEALLESSKDEDEAEILRCIVVLKIPVLLSMNVSIDTQMTAKISRCLADMEDGTCLEVPILFALYELFMRHQIDVADTLGHIVFDRNHYALGQRMMNLTRLTQIVMLSSKQLCYNCFSDKLKKHEKEIRGIYPEFFSKYFEARIKLWRCNSCRKETGDLKEEPPQQTVSHVVPNETLTWRQIIDKRVEAKTRYFVTPKHKTPVVIEDKYSNKWLPILWSCIANRLTSAAGFYLDNDERIRSGNMHDMLMIKIFQYLARCVFGSSGPTCIHIANIASHAGELISHFIRYEDAIVRRTVLSLLGVILSIGEAKIFVIEALSIQGNLINKLDVLLDTEQDDENRKFLQYIQRFVTEATTVGLLSDLSQSSKKSPFSVL